MDTASTGYAQGGQAPSAVWAVPATCGEPVQGFHRGRWLQIAAPVNLYRNAAARVVPLGSRGAVPEQGGVGIERARIRLEPPAELSDGAGESVRHADEPPRGAGGSLEWADGSLEGAGGCPEGVHGPFEAAAGAGRSTAQGSAGRFDKVRRALRLLLVARPALAVNVRLGGDDLVRGAGFGSSTADIGAALRAAADVLGIANPSRTVVDTALQVEPTSGSLVHDIALFDHRAGTIRESIGPPPRLSVLCLRLPGHVDTVTFNRALPTRLPESALRLWDRAFRLCTQGIASGDLRKVGDAASMSADAARHLGCTPVARGLAECARRTASVGIVRAHSGTAWGLLYPEGEAPPTAEVANILGRTEVALRPVVPEGGGPVAALRLVGGGFRRLPGCPSAS